MQERATTQLRTSERAQAYLPALDGLRAVAILLVVLYHAGISWLPGGFVGVDVFFVLSGYLIIGQITAGVRAGTFSYAEFWSRRALRILPPYALVLAAAMLAAPFVLFFPEDLQEFGYEVGASAIFQANHFYLSEQGYFDRGAETRVLLHLWSLAVEEQFYVVAPLAIGATWLLARRTRARTLPIAVATVIALASLAGCILLTGEAGGKNYAFFLMPLRAWEFMAGGGVALLVPHLARIPRLALEVLGMAGLAAIVAAGHLLSSNTAFPSWTAAWPVAATCVVLGACLADRRLLVARLLSLRVVTFVGLVSYSWYLWHWPILVIGRLNRFGERDLAIDLALVGVALILAIATYLAVERPLRQWRRKRLVDWRPGAALVAGSVGLGLAGLAAFSLSAIMRPGDMAAEDAAPRMRMERACRIQSMDDIGRCMGTATGYGILIGDSQAESAAAVLQQEARRHSMAIVTAVGGGCAPLTGVDLKIPDPAMADRCSETREILGSALANGTVEPSFAILVARWQLYAAPGSRYGLAGTVGGLDDDSELSVLVASLKATIGALRSAGARRVLVLAPSPEFTQAAPRCMALADGLAIDRDLKCSEPRGAVEAANHAAQRWLDLAAGADDLARIVNPMDVFCDEKRCRPFDGDTILFRDTNHLSDAGMQAIVERHGEDFGWIFRMTAEEP